MHQSAFRHLFTRLLSRLTPLLAMACMLCATVAQASGVVQTAVSAPDLAANRQYGRDLFTYTQEQLVAAQKHNRLLYNQIVVLKRLACHPPLPAVFQPPEPTTTSA